MRGENVSWSRAEPGKWEAEPRDETGEREETEPAGCRHAEDGRRENEGKERVSKGGTREEGGREKREEKKE